MYYNSTRYAELVNSVIFYLIQTLPQNIPLIFVPTTFHVTMRTNLAIQILLAFHSWIVNNIFSRYSEACCIWLCFLMRVECVAKYLSSQHPFVNECFRYIIYTYRETSVNELQYLLLMFVYILTHEKLQGQRVVEYSMERSVLNGKLLNCFPTLRQQGPPSPLPSVFGRTNGCTGDSHCRD